MNIRKTRTTLALVFFGGLLAASTALAGNANANGVLDRAEKWDADTFGSVYCMVLDESPDMTGIAVVAQSIIDDGFDMDSAVDVLNYTVDTYCPRHHATFAHLHAQLNMKV